MVLLNLSPERDKKRQTGLDGWTILTERLIGLELDMGEADSPKTFTGSTTLAKVLKSPFSGESS